MNATGRITSGADLVHSARTRNALAKRLSASAGAMTTAVIAAMEEQQPWFKELHAQERSWVNIVATRGIESFIHWFAGDQEVDARDIFRAAPRALTRNISLAQTVELIQTTIDVVEQHIGEELPRSDRAVLQQALLYYSREVAFASAKVYARAAESRGAWDERTEALIVDAIARGDSDESLLSRASALGWKNGEVTVLVGGAPDLPDLDKLRAAAHELKLTALAAVHGTRLIVVLGHVDGQFSDDAQTIAAAEALAPHFGAGPLVVGPRVPSLAEAAKSARRALSGARAAIAWPEGPKVMSATQLLPERALAGNSSARKELVDEVYLPLLHAGGDLLETCVGFLDHSGSMEATARALYVHANTVRYRIKRIVEVTGYSPAEARGAYVLRLAISLGRLHGE